MTAVRLRLDAYGLAFAAKGQPDALRDIEAVVATTSQQVEVRGRHPRPWTVSVDDGTELRRRLGTLRRGLARWSPDDVGVFAACALWTYVSMPSLLEDPAVEVRSLPGRRLHVRLPDAIVSHCRDHVLHLDEDGLIRRHDYTAFAFGRWARAAQLVDGYRDVDGHAMATRRRVHPRLAGRPLAAITLVSIDIREACTD